MSEYFSHDYDAREDEKIQELLFELEMEGYGIYWSIIEMLYKNDGYMQMNCERIAYALHTDEVKINRVVNDFDLFKINGNAFTSTSVLHRLKLRKGKTVTAKKAAKVRWDKARAKYADAMQTQCDSNAKKKRKEKERNESKVNEIIMPFDDEKFIAVWDLWKRYKKEQYRFEYKPIGEQGALQDIANLSNGDLDTAIAIIHQSIKKGWKGLFTIIDELKNTPKSKIDEFIKSYQESIKYL